MMSSKKTILIVDHEASAIEMITAALTQGDRDVLAVPNIRLAERFYYLDQYPI